MDEPILLSGQPRELGQVYGEIAGAHLRERVARMHGEAARSMWTETALLERGRAFGRIMARHAGDWQSEASGVASGAGVSFEDLLVLNSLPDDFWGAEGGGCTSCIVAGSTSAEGGPLLHKNRDLENSVQDTHVRCVGDSRVLASREVGNIGFAHFHSTRGLAGANNTGAYVHEAERRDCAFRCVHLLRLVAERAGTCDEAVAVLEDAVAGEFAGTSGATRGMIFLFVDRAGGVVVEMTSKRLTVRHVADGAEARTNHFVTDAMQSTVAQEPDHNTRRRLERVHELLDPLDTVSARDLVALSRDYADDADSICNAKRGNACSTVSACTHVAGAPGVSHVSMGHPHNTLCIPVPVTVDGLPAACVSGDMSAQARAALASRGLGDHLAAVQDERERAMAGELALPGANATALVARWVDEWMNG
ncbi:hypothetical protein HQ560_05050 [bacterium]|nr:hypothetical protein [bacterium]